MWTGDFSVARLVGAEWAQAEKGPAELMRGPQPTNEFGMLTGRYQQTCRQHHCSLKPR